MSKSKYSTTIIKYKKQPPEFHGTSRPPPGYMWSLDHDLEHNFFGRRPPLTSIIRPDYFPQPDAKTMVVHGD